MVEFRVPKPGLVCFTGDEGERDDCEGAESTCLGTGEAGIVLSLFLRASWALDPIAVLVEDDGGRVVLEFFCVRVDRELLVAVLNAVLVGLPESRKTDEVPFSLFVPEAKEALQLVEDRLAAVFRKSAFNPRHSDWLIEGFVFSSKTLSSLLRLSTELTEGLFVWLELAAVAAVALVAFRRTDDEGKRRVGGLLRPVPGLT